MSFTQQICVAPTLLDYRTATFILAACVLFFLLKKLLFQDLLSFELLDINIVQELEKVPYNSRVGK